MRSRRLSPDLLDAWLVLQPIEKAHPRYELRLWCEDHSQLQAIKPELLAYLDEAHSDARRRLRRGFEDSLSPFVDPGTDPANGYPGLLHQVTLQGYFGETLAGLAIEHWGANGTADWMVPAFLFRFHVVEFQHLESIQARLLAGELHEPDLVSEIRPGRTGDDGLAFRMNADGKITDVIALEAKCLAQSSARKIREAHTKLASAGSRPSGIRELIEILEDYASEEAKKWQAALLEFWTHGHVNVVRLDGLGYACGNRPQVPTRRAWLPVAAPHASYTAQRNLEGLEFHFESLDEVLEQLYRGG